MRKPLVTAGMGAASGSVAALVQWVFTSYGHPVPIAVLPILTAIFMYFGHYIEAYIDAKFGGIVDPVTPAPVVLPTQVK